MFPFAESFRSSFDTCAHENVVAKYHAYGKAYKLFHIPTQENVSFFSFAHILTFIQQHKSIASIQNGKFPRI